MKRKLTVEPTRRGVRILARHHSAASMPQPKVVVRVGGGPRLTGSIVVTVTDNRRAPASSSIYHELNPDFTEREGVYQLRDDGLDSWDRTIGVGLFPSHDCKHRELAERFVDALEQRLGKSLEWAGFSHRDTPNPHVHLTLKDPREGDLSKRSFDRLERTIQDAAKEVYSAIREEQREFMRERDQERDRER